LYISYKKLSIKKLSIKKLSIKKLFMYYNEMPECKQNTTDIYDIPDTEEKEDQYPPSLYLFRTIAHTPLTDPRGIMRCDCHFGSECYSYEHWKNRWILIQPNPEYSNTIKD
jgi:hypothetical protein